MELNQKLDSYLLKIEEYKKYISYENRIRMPGYLKIMNEADALAWIINENNYKI
jgi:hypothetical protein